MKEREREILHMYFGIGQPYALTLEEIGKEFALTIDQVRQIKNDAIIDAMKQRLGGVEK